MEFKTFIFYWFALVLLFGALRVITCRNPVHAAMWLVLCFFTAAGVWLLLHAEFLAITLVLVYVGAVMVLFLFVIMMLDVNLLKLKENFRSYWPVGAMVGVLVAFEMASILFVAYDRAPAAVAPEHGADYSNTRELGLLLYTEYVYAFEIAAVLLLVAIVAAIALTYRRRKGVRQQDVGEQVRVKKGDRLRLIKVPTEPAAEAAKPGDAAA
ncbi:MAG: NADH-quinone oxidoreductase subunit J [Betaproteobacteria bacterium]|jgi:NADH-quinone oxidoreductase subunit J|nr:NADH-quinone oxidoreductase subunit J [Betaproteobacteria bacterium]